MSARGGGGRGAGGRLAVPPRGEQRGTPAGAAPGLRHPHPWGCLFWGNGAPHSLLPSPGVSCSLGGLRKGEFGVLPAPGGWGQGVLGVYALGARMGCCPGDQSELCPAHFGKCHRAGFARLDEARPWGLM